MLYDYLKRAYKNSEPIFLAEIDGYSKEYVRQEMKRLTDEGKLERLYNGVYYISYKTILGTKGRVSIKRFIEKKFLSDSNGIQGYYTGLYLANSLGFTTQNPSCYEVCSNNATTKQRKMQVDGFELIVYKPVVEISKDNFKELQFLDLMTVIDKYNELKNEEMRKKLREFVDEYKIDFLKVKSYLPFYPDKVYKNIYIGGLMDELV